MKRFMFLISVMLIVLAIQPIVYALPVSEGLLDGTSWNVVFTKYDSETGEWLATYPGYFQFNSGELYFAIGDICSSTSYSSFMLPLSIAWSADVFVNGEVGYNFSFDGRAGKKMQYMNGTVNTDMGVYYKFVGKRVENPA